MPNKKIIELNALGRNAVAGDLIAGWDGETGKTVRIDVSELPTGGGGGGGGDVVQLGSPFPVRVTDGSYSYNAGTGNTTITDIRLIGKTDYAVIATQLGGNEFDDNRLTYDAIAGTVVISAFQLDADAKLRIYADGVVNSTLTDFIKALQDQLTLLNLIAAPYFTTALGPNGGKVFWGLPADTIPPGWQEYTAMRGRLPLAADPDNVDWSIVGTPIGDSDPIIINENNIQKFNINLPTNDGKITPGGAFDGKYVGTEETSATTATAAIGVDAPDGIDKMNPCRIVMWIEFVGI